MVEQVISDLVARIVVASSRHEKVRTTFSGTKGIFTNVPLIPGEEYIVFVSAARARITVPSMFRHMLTIASFPHILF